MVIGPDRGPANLSTSNRELFPATIEDGIECAVRYTCWRPDFSLQSGLSQMNYERDTRWLRGDTIEDWTPLRNVTWKGRDRDCPLAMRPCAMVKVLAVLAWHGHGSRPERKRSKSAPDSGNQSELWLLVAMETRLRFGVGDEDAALLQVGEILPRLTPYGPTKTRRAWHPGLSHVQGHLELISKLLLLISPRSSKPDYRDIWFRRCTRSCKGLAVAASLFSGWVAP